MAKGKKTKEAPLLEFKVGLKDNPTLTVWAGSEELAIAKYMLALGVLASQNKFAVDRVSPEDAAPPKDGADADRLGTAEDDQEPNPGPAGGGDGQ